jgi:uncharacterized protein GlcG (DUF336 family)
MPNRLRLIALLAVLTVPAAPSAQAAAPPAPLPALGGTITSDQAQRIMAAAEAETRRRNWEVAITIVENNGALVMFKKTDGVQYGSIEVSMQKARSAALFRRPSKVFGDAAASGAPGLIGLEGVAAVEGGIPILQGGRQIGAIGVSGMASDEDAVIAAAGAAAVR